VARLHVDHAQGNETWLEDFVVQMARPYDVTLHDYYFLTPKVHLTDATGRFVGDEHLDDGTGWPVTGLAEWRARSRKFLAGAQRVLAPSRDLAERYRRYYQEVRLRVAPHFEDPRPETVPVNPRPCAGTDRLRVVLLGYLQAHKGESVVLVCARLARERKLPIEFHVVGSFEAPLPDDADLKVSGVYEPQNLPALLSAADPHLAWLPAQCPESYSYTLSEALRAGLPVLASNLGALPERLSGRPWSWVFQWDAGPEAWLDRLMEIRERHFVRGEPAPAVGAPPDWDVNFYRDHYLDWIAGAAASVGKAR
jgi:glycosyltransferase involved in cell wall biosynthesis